jgi:hypothetical protein
MPGLGSRAKALSAWPAYKHLIMYLLAWYAYFGQRNQKKPLWRHVVPVVAASR